MGARGPFPYPRKFRALQGKNNFFGQLGVSVYAHFNAVVIFLQWWDALRAKRKPKPTSNSTLVVMLSIKLRNLIARWLLIGMRKANPYIDLN